MLELVLIIILKAILWGALVMLLLLGYLAYYSCKALKCVLRRIYHRLRERRSYAPSRLRFDKNTGELEEF